MAMSACLECGADVTVCDSRRRDGYVMRRYRCLTCGYRFTTEERPIEKLDTTARDTARRLRGLLTEALEALPAA
jgi:transcriptional regulator NrdR family protein